VSVADDRATRRWLVTDLLLLALALALVVGVVAFWNGRADAPQSERSATSVRQLAVSEVARAQTEAFLAVDHRDMDAVVAQVLGGATGEFAAEYVADEDELVRSVRRSRTVVTSVARAIGVGELAEDRAVVLVAADTQVRTRQRPPQLRKHRLRVEVVREDERWLVSQLEFVR
jgi:Mce-associated membrane protein